MWYKNTGSLDKPKVQELDGCFKSPKYNFDISKYHTYLRDENVRSVWYKKKVIRTIEHFIKFWCSYKKT